MGPNRALRRWCIRLFLVSAHVELALLLAVQRDGEAQVPRVLRARREAEAPPALLRASLHLGRNTQPRAVLVHMQHLEGQIFGRDRTMLIFSPSRDALFGQRTPLVFLISNTSTAFKLLHFYLRYVVENMLFGNEYQMFVLLYR